MPTKPTPICPTTGHHLKTDHAEREARIDELVHLMAEGVRWRELVAYGIKKWDVTERTLDKYIQAGYKELAKAAAVYRDREVGRAIVRLDAIYAEAWKGLQFDLCLKVVREMSRLLGLNAPEYLTLDVPKAWHEVFDQLGLRRAGNGENGIQGTDGDGKNAPQVQH